MARLLTKDDVIIDLGAHIGNASIGFAHHAKEVYAFEPNNVVFAELKARTRPYRNIQIFNNAVSDKTGQMDLYFEDGKQARFYEGSTTISGKPTSLMRTTLL